jgi:hypothetical protein
MVAMITVPSVNSKGKKEPKFLLSPFAKIHTGTGKNVLPSPPDH